MTIIKTYTLYCTACGREYKDDAFDDIDDVFKYYPKDWKSETVENGSIWDFCPKCLEHHENEKKLNERK